MLYVSSRWQKKRRKPLSWLPLRLYSCLPLCRHQQRGDGSAAAVLLRWYSGNR
jgi:hypothetical protein